jgi:type I restriction enzyme S subunit
LDLTFLSQFLLSRFGREYFEKSARGTSGSMVKIDRALLEGFPLLLPPLPEQRKIAAILSSVDDAIEKTQAVIEQVQVVKKGLMQELLTRGLPGRHTKFKQTEIGEVPEEWEVLRLQALGKGDGRPVLRTGPFGSSLKTEHFTDRGTPVLNIQCLGEGEILEDGLFYVDDQKAQELTEYRVAEGDLVFSRVADVGRSVVIPREAEGWIISSNLMRISPNPNVVDPHFLMYSIVGSGAVVRQIEGVTAKGGRAVVSSLILNGLVFPIPALEEQRVIASSLQAVEQRVRTERFHTQRLAGVKSALMSVLLTGEVRVTPDSEAA